MMSGIELNELMTKVSNGSNAISNFEPVQKPYNRELWRIDNGILEEDLVNFVLDKSKKKIDQLGESLRMPIRRSLDRILSDPGSAIMCPRLPEIFL